LPVTEAQLSSQVQQPLSKAPAFAEISREGKKARFQFWQIVVEGFVEGFGECPILPTQSDDNTSTHDCYDERCHVSMTRGDPVLLSNFGDVGPTSHYKTKELVCSCRLQNSNVK